ncbi:CBS and ACT domain-containing protein [Spirochaetia bacterium 38H-sp]|uniref:CBS and ACT domain-containing protein n=1 Tax=Rarispira pelagica TaxID=3141764 RepID=A0ABU9U9B2_9SPIR
MRIKEIMTKNPVAVTADINILEAKELLKKEKIHRLPVTDSQGKIQGIIAEKDLLYVSPSPATTLNVYEMAGLLSKVKVRDIMTKDVITVNPESYIEDAARIMVDNNIGGLPVCMDDGLLVGIVTESDIFKRFVELFGTRKKGVRLTAVLPERKGELADISSVIANAGGNIISIATFLGETSQESLCIIKIEGLEENEVRKVTAPYLEKLVDIATV